MRTTQTWGAIFVGVFTVLIASGSAQDPDTEYVISTRILSLNPQDARPMQQLSTETIRVRPGIMTAFTGDTDNFRLAMTASELTPGKVALHVVFETRGGGPVRASVFDVVSGDGFSAPTAALRDPSGAFLKDKQGQPLFFEVSTAVRPNN